MNMTQSSIAFHVAFLLVVIFSIASAQRRERNATKRRFISKYTDEEDKYCKWTKRANAPEVFYVNMDKSGERKTNMERHLKNVGLNFFRVRGNPWKEIYVPGDVQNLWSTRWCMLNTEEEIPSKQDVLRNSSSPLNGFSSIMSGLCGRGKDKHGKDKNTLKEIGCTTSHLMAMRDAIYSTTSNSRYAIIIEDDVKFPFDVDYEALANTAPPGFGILQLFNSNKQSMVYSWGEYLKKGKLWHRSEKLIFWSTCAYMIDRAVMKPVIDKVVYELNGWQHYKVIAGISGPCAPRECCINGTDTRWGYYGTFVHSPPCVEAAYGYQADSFLYAMATTYMLGIPLISNGIGGHASTFHQDHVESLHREAFKKQRQIINEMLSGKANPPEFAKSACRALNESQI